MVNRRSAVGMSYRDRWQSLSTGWSFPFRPRGKEGLLELLSAVFGILDFDAPLKSG